MTKVDGYGSIELPCGGTAFYDGDFSHRCMHCDSVVGSIGMPVICKELYNNEVKKELLWKVLSE